MACARCDFYVPKQSSRAQSIEAKANLLRLKQEIPLNEDELRAVEDGISGHERLVHQLSSIPCPARKPIALNLIRTSLVLGDQEC